MLIFYHEIELAMAKILVSAYACEPNKGSEPEVGWQWVKQIATKHEVWVLTKANNKENIENYIGEIPDEYSNIHFVYVMLSKRLTFWKKGNRGMRPYYYLWAKKAYRTAKRLHEKIKFDLIHSVTFVSYTQPCFMYKLGIPFVWTIAGGESIPKEIQYPMTWKERLYEAGRSIGQKKAWYSYNTRKAMDECQLFLATTPDTLKQLPGECQKRTIVTSAIGIEKIEEIKNYSSGLASKVLLSGKFVYLKGIDIGIKAIFKIIKKYPDVKFEVFGNGKYEERYHQMCESYGDRIKFTEYVPHNLILDYYRGFDVMINTALRDSGCLMAMEAMSVGMPIVCIDSGGVKEMTTKQTAIKVEPCQYEELVQKIADGLEKLIQSSELREKLGRNAYRRIKECYLYSSKGAMLLSEYEKLLSRSVKESSR